MPEESKGEPEAFTFGSLQADIRRVIRDINLTVASLNLAVNTLQVLMDDATYLGQKLGAVPKAPEQPPPGAPKETEAPPK